MFMNLIEAAEFLRISSQTLYRWVHQRRIPVRKHGSRLVFSRADLERWSAAQAIGEYRKSPCLDDEKRAIRSATRERGLSSLTTEYSGESLPAGRA